MANLRTDLRDYWQHARRHYVNLVLGAVMALIGFAAGAVGLAVPAWVFWILAIVFLVTAQFRTYRDVRNDLNAIRATIEVQEARRKRLLEDREIKGETLYVWELFSPTEKPVVDNRTFTDCVFVGPAIVTLLGEGTFEGNRVGEGELEGILYPAPQKDVGYQGIFGFLDCTIRHCRFKRVGFMGPEALLEKFRRVPIV